jgi:AP-3 complex subunit beta
MSLASLQSNAARLTQRLQESIVESTRDLSLRASNANGFSPSSSLTLSSTDEAQIKKLLSSQSDRDKLDGMRRLLAFPLPQTLTYFPLILHLLPSQSLPLRQLTHLYLTRAAPHEPDLALLSINAFTKDLKDHNPLIRSMALKTLSSVGNVIPGVAPVVREAIKDCVRDTNPYVRRVAAFALIKCYQ